MAYAASQWLWRPCQAVLRHCEALTTHGQLGVRLAEPKEPKVHAPVCAAIRAIRTAPAPPSVESQPHSSAAATKQHTWPTQQHRNTPTSVFLRKRGNPMSVLICTIVLKKTLTPTRQHAARTASGWPRQALPRLNGRPASPPPPTALHRPHRIPAHTAPHTSHLITPHHTPHLTRRRPRGGRGRPWPRPRRRAVARCARAPPSGTRWPGRQNRPAAAARPAAGRDDTTKVCKKDARQ